jgi:hypothetical protein
MFADTDTAAIEGNLAFTIGSFIGDEHLGIAVGALHMDDPWSDSS